MGIFLIHTIQTSLVQVCLYISTPEQFSISVQESTHIQSRKVIKHMLLYVP